MEAAASSGVRLEEGLPQPSRVTGATPLLNRKVGKKAASGKQSSSGDAAADSSKTVLFLCGRGGGGHKAASLAVRDCLEYEGLAWSSSIEILDAGSLFDLMVSGAQSKLFDGDEW